MGCMSSDQATSINPENESSTKLNYHHSTKQERGDEGFIMRTSLRVQTKDCFDCTEKITDPCIQFQVACPTAQVPYAKSTCKQKGLNLIKGYGKKG